jgi:putative heme transporter
MARTDVEQDVTAPPPPVPQAVAPPVPQAVAPLAPEAVAPPVPPPAVGPAPQPDPAPPETGGLRGVTADLDWHSLVVVAAVLAGVVVMLDLARAVNDTVVHLLVAVVVALALDRVVRLAQRTLRLSRRAAVAVVLSAAVALAAAFAVLVVPAMVDQAGKLGEQAPAVLNDLTELPVIGQSLEENDVPLHAQRWLEQFPEQLTSDGDALMGTAQAVIILTASVVGGLLLLVLLLLEGPALQQATRRSLPGRWRGPADVMARAVYVVIGRYAVGSVLLALMAGTAAFLIGVAFAVPLVALAAIWAMLWNFVPQLGGVMGGALLVALALTDSVTTALLVMVVWLVYMQLENRIVQPVVVGRAVQLSPLTTMVIALLGVAVAGLVGAVLAIPLVAAVNAARHELRGLRGLP